MKFFPPIKLKNFVVILHREYSGFFIGLMSATIDERVRTLATVDNALGSTAEVNNKQAMSSRRFMKAVIFSVEAIDKNEKELLSRKR